MCREFIEPYIPVTDADNVKNLQRRSGNVIVVGQSESGKTHTGLYCSVQKTNHDNKAVKKKLYTVKNVTPLDYDAQTYEDWRGGRTDACFFEFPLKAGARAKPLAKTLPAPVRKGKTRTIKPRSFGENAPPKEQRMNHAEVRIRKRATRERELREAANADARVVHNQRYEDMGPTVRRLHSHDHLSLSDYNLVCLQNSVSRNFSNEYMENMRGRVLACDSLFSDEDRDLLVESLSWLSRHRSKCDRLTKVSEEEVTISTYSHADWAFGIDISENPATTAFLAVVTSVHVIRTLGWLVNWYKERAHRNNAPSDSAETIQPSFDKLNADTCVRRFAQMYATQTPLPTSAIQQKRITVVTQVGNGYSLTDNYVCPENRVIYVTQTKHTAQARIAYSPLLARGAMELLDDMFKRPLCDRVFTHCDSQHMNHRTINDAHSVINLNSLNGKVSTAPKCVVVFHAEKYANRLK